MIPENPHKDLENQEYVSWVHFLDSAENWSSEEIKTYQFNEIARVVTLAYDKTKGYRSLYDAAGFHPTSLHTLEDVKRIPFVTKEMIRENPEAFTVPGVACTLVSTGGSSTGIPFSFHRSKSAFSKELASKAHQYHRVGWREGDRQFVLRGVQIADAKRLQFIHEYNELRASSFDLDSHWMEKYWRAWLEYNPEWLRCYPSTGYAFAQYLLLSNTKVPPLKGILCASENLYDYQKQVLAEVFGCRVFSHYGHSELAVLAGYCELADTYHVLPQYGYAELIDAEGKAVYEPGAMGEIVSTSFIQDATLFVRYRTCDMATLSGNHCPACGRPYQIWQHIDGRMQEFFITSTGRAISATAAIAAVHDDTWSQVSEFQFHQRIVGEVEFRFVPRAECKTAIIEDLKRRIENRLNNEVLLTMIPVQKIERTGRAKSRILIQDLDTFAFITKWATTNQTHVSK